MNKVLFIGDFHLSDRQIGTRVDDTTETCLEKLQWILDFAKSQKADIISTGDIFSHTLYSNKTRYRIKQMLKEFNNSGLSFWTISGNHSGDVKDRDFSTVAYSELGQFIYDGYIKFLGCLDGGLPNEYWLKDSRTCIVGFSAYTERPFWGVDYEPTKMSNSQVVGLICHHWIMDAFGDSLVVYPDDMKKIFPNLKFIVAGHDHAFHEPYTSRDGVLVVRPGSVMRTDSGKSSDRIPQVVLFTPGFGIEEDKWEYFPIGCARPYSEVFYSEKKQLDADSVSVLDKFVRQMQNHSGTVMDINSAIKEQLELVPYIDLEMVKQDLATQGYILQ